MPDVTWLSARRLGACALASAVLVALGTATSAGATAVTKMNSTAWAGYADTGSGFKQVSGTWTEPGATSCQTGSGSMFWVGFDGLGNQDNVAAGTVIICAGSKPYYGTWWAVAPANEINIVSETVEPGDVIHASVTRSGKTYTLKVTDSTHPANSFTTARTCPDCANSSAEWIDQVPGLDQTPSQPDFGTWKLRGAKVTNTSKSGVISSFPHDEITMIGAGGVVTAKPSALNSTGNGFTVTQEH